MIIMINLTVWHEKLTYFENFGLFLKLEQELKIGE